MWASGTGKENGPVARESKRTRDERRYGKPIRVIDRALSGRWKLPSWCAGLSDDFMAGAAEYRNKIIEDLGQATCVVADNVCEFLYAETPKEEWDIFKDFPCCAPPRPILFIEMLRPSRILSEGNVISSSRLPEAWGWLFKFTDRKTIIEKLNSEEHRNASIKSVLGQLNELAPKVDLSRLAEAKNSPDPMESVSRLTPIEQTVFMLGVQYAALQKGINIEQAIPKEAAWGAELELIMASGDNVTMPASVRLMIGENGSILHRPNFAFLGGTALDTKFAEQLRDSFNSISYPALLALSFMHCKNISLQQNEPDRALNNKRRHAGLKPFVRYHTINIEPMKKVLKTEGNSETEGLKRALHICRGHFSTYSEERPLFGRIAGTFWVPSHVRGSIKEGIVVSDYKVKV